MCYWWKPLRMGELLAGTLPSAGAPGLSPPHRAGGRDSASQPLATSKLLSHFLWVCVPECDEIRVAVPRHTTSDPSVTSHCPLGSCFQTQAHGPVLTTQNRGPRVPAPQAGLLEASLGPRGEWGWGLERGMPSL